MYKDKYFADWTADDFLEAYDNGYTFNEEEIEQLAWGEVGFGEEITREEGDSGRWNQYMTTIIKVKDRYFGVGWSAGLTECQESYYDGPVYEVKPVKKMIEVTEWVSVEKEERE